MLNTSNQDVPWHWNKQDMKDGKDLVLKRHTDEKLNFDGWIYTLRGCSLHLKNFEMYHINENKPFKMQFLVCILVAALAFLICTS